MTKPRSSLESWLVLKKLNVAFLCHSSPPIIVCIVAGTRYVFFVLIPHDYDEHAKVFFVGQLPARIPCTFDLLSRLLSPALLPQLWKYHTGWEPQPSRHRRAGHANNGCSFNQNLCGRAVNVTVVLKSHLKNTVIHRTQLCPFSLHPFIRYIIYY